MVSLHFRVLCNFKRVEVTTNLLRSILRIHYVKNVRLRTVSRVCTFI